MHGQFAGLAGADAGHGLVETFDLAVAEAEHRAETNDFFRGAGKDLVAVLEGEVRGDVIARFRRTVDRHEAAAVGQNPLQGLIDVGVGKLPHRLLDLQALPLRQVELRADLQVELEGHRALLRHFDRFQIQFRLADGRKVVIVVDLGQAVHQQRALDPADHVFAKAILDQFPRRVTGPETRHVGRRHQLAELLVQVAIDVLARHGHGDVPLAGAAVVDLDLQIQLGLFFLALLALIGDRLIGDDLSRSQSPLVLQGFIVVVLVCVCHDDMPPARTWNSLAKPISPRPRAGRHCAGSSEAWDRLLGKKKERVMGFEPTTTTLATSCSTN